MLEFLAVAVIVFIASIIVLYRYGLKLLDYCCIESTNVVMTSINEVFKPPKWSSILASRIAYIDDEVPLIISDTVRSIGSKLSLAYGVNPFEESLGLFDKTVLVLKFLRRYMKQNGFNKTLLFVKTYIKIKIYRVEIHRLRKRSIMKYRVLAGKLYKELRRLEELA